MRIWWSKAVTVLSVLRSHSLVVRCQSSDKEI